MDGIRYDSAIILEDDMWMITFDNVIVKMDLNDFRYSVADYKEDASIGSVVKNIACDNAGNIYWVETGGRRLFKYNTIKNELREISLCNAHKKEKVEVENIYCCNDNIYIIPSDFAALIKYNIESEEIELLKYMMPNDNGEIISSTMVDKSIYFFGKKTKMLFVINTANDVISETCRLEFDIKCMQSDGGKIYMLNENASIFSYSIGDDKIRKIVTIQDISTIDFCLSPQKIYVFPSKGDAIVVVDKGSNKYQMFNDFPSDFVWDNKDGFSKFIGHCESKRYIWCNNRIANYKLRIDKITDKIEWYKSPEMTVEEKIKYQKHIKTDFYIEEIWGLNDYLKLLVN